MGSRMQSTVGCFPELCFLQFSAAQVLVGSRKQFINNFVFQNWACTAGFNNNNKNNDADNNSYVTKYNNKTCALAQVKELVKKEVERSDADQRRSSAIITDYKAICTQLSTRLEAEHQRHLQQVEDIKVSSHLIFL